MISRRQRKFDLVALPARWLAPLTWSLAEPLAFPDIEYWINDYTKQRTVLTLICINLLFALYIQTCLLSLLMMKRPDNDPVITLLRETSLSIIFGLIPQCVILFAVVRLIAVYKSGLFLIRSKLAIVCRSLMPHVI